MKVLINPEYHERGKGESYFVTWNNPVLRRALDEVFCIELDKRINQIEIDKGGIQVRIEKIPE